MVSSYPDIMQEAKKGIIILAMLFIQRELMVVRSIVEMVIRASIGWITVYGPFNWAGRCWLLSGKNSPCSQILLSL